MGAPPAVFVGREAELARIAAAAEPLRLILVYGIAGIGKTAFSLQAAAHLAGRLGARVIVHECHAGESAASVAEAVLRQLGVTPPGRDPAAALEAAAAAGPLVLCLDDAHHLREGGTVATIVEWARRRGPFWCVLAAREALPISPAAVDHLVVRLGGLTRGEIRRLWQALAPLYGTAGAALDLEDVARRTGGSPRWLKEVFADPSVAASPDLLGLSDLAPVAVALLTQAAAFHRPVPLAAVTPAAATAAAAGAARELARRLLLDLMAGDLVLVPPEVRAAVARGAHAPGAAHHARCLAHCLSLRGGGRPDPALELEILHHAAAAGEDDLAGEIIVWWAARCDRLPPGCTARERDLRGACDLLAARRTLPPLARFARARIRARDGDLAGAAQDLASLPADVPCDLEQGEVAFMRGDLAAAETRLARAADDQRRPPLGRLWALAGLGATRALQGLRPGIDDVVGRHGALLAELGAVGDGVSQVLRGVALQWEDRHAAAAEALAAAQRALAGPARPAMSRALLSGLERAVAAARGVRGTAAEPRGDDHDDESLFFQLVAQLLRADEALLQGRAREAGDTADEAMSTAAQAGFRALEWWGLRCWGQAQLVRGRPQAVLARLEPQVDAAARAGHGRAHQQLAALMAHALLAQHRPEAARPLALQVLATGLAPRGTAAGLRGVAALADAVEGLGSTAAPAEVAGDADGYGAAAARLTATELLLWRGDLDAARPEAASLERLAAAAGWRWLACRARLLGAEAAFRQGHFTTTERALTIVQREVAELGYAAQAARAGLLWAGLLRTQGDRRGALQWLAQVGAEAAALGLRAEEEAAHFAAEVMRRGAAPSYSPGQALAQRVGLAEPPSVELRTETSARALATSHLREVDLTRYAALVDLVGRQIRIQGAWVDLSRGKSRLEVLRVLCEQPGRLIPMAHLVRAAWGFEYHPANHYSRVAMAISRLRERLGPSTFAGTKEGFALQLPAPWAVIAPAAGARRGRGG